MTFSRIGKSELIKQALKETDIKSIYYECKQTTEQNNVDSLAELIGEAFDFPKSAFENMEHLLKFLFKKSEQEPLILVLDEYSYLRENVFHGDGVFGFFTVPSGLALSNIIKYSLRNTGMRFLNIFCQNLTRKNDCIHKSPFS